jgi:N-carbamoylputrescine amidase
MVSSAPMTRPASRAIPATRKTASGSFTIGLVQLAVSTDSRENLAHALARVAEAAKQGAQVICLPELFRSQYFCQTEEAALFNLAEPAQGPTTQAFQALARKQKVAVVVPFFERRAPGVYHNSAAVIDTDGSVKGLYRKMHIPDDPSYYEKFYFTPGDLGFRAFDVKPGRISTLICWDQWYPEGARLSALQGALVLFYPTAIGWHPAEKAQYGAAQRDAWRTVQRGHAVANGIYVAAVNRIGLEKTTPDAAGLEFWGSSFIADPQGVVVAEAPTDREAILVAEIDADHLEDVRRSWPFLRDRRIDAYGGITSRFLDDATIAAPDAGVGPSRRRPSLAVRGSLRGRRRGTRG